MSLFSSQVMGTHDFVLWILQGNYLCLYFNSFMNILPCYVQCCSPRLCSMFYIWWIIPDLPKLQAVNVHWAFNLSFDLNSNTKHFCAVFQDLKDLNVSDDTLSKLASAENSFGRLTRVHKTIYDYKASSINIKDCTSTIPRFPTEPWIHSNTKPIKVVNKCKC